MSRDSMFNIAWSALIGILIGGGISYLLGLLIVTIGADGDLESAVRDVQAIATDRGGVVRSVHQNDSHSYSITAIVRADKLRRLQTLLDEQSDSVTWEYVYAPSKEHDDYLRVGVDLGMTPEQYSSEWSRQFVSSANILFMSVWFALLSCSVFLISICAFAATKPAVPSESRSY